MRTGFVIAMMVIPAWLTLAPEPGPKGECPPMGRFACEHPLGDTVPQLPEVKP
jgi:hypothetical protein